MFFFFWRLSITQTKTSCRVSAYFICRLSRYSVDTPEIGDSGEGGRGGRDAIKVSLERAPRLSVCSRGSRRSQTVWNCRKANAELGPRERVWRMRVSLISIGPCPPPPARWPALPDSHRSGKTRSCRFEFFFFWHWQLSRYRVLCDWSNALSASLATVAAHQIHVCLTPFSPRLRRFMSFYKHA